MKHILLTVAALSICSVSADWNITEPDGYIDAVMVVGPEDLSIVRFSLRHLLANVAHVHTVYVVTRATPRMASIIEETNHLFSTAAGGVPHVELFDEVSSPLSRTLHSHDRRRRRHDCSLALRFAIIIARLDEL